MQYDLDNETAMVCLDMLLLGDFGPNALHFRLLELFEDLALDNVGDIDPAIVHRINTLPEEITDLGEELDNELDFDPIFIRLHYIATGRRALQAARYARGKEGLEGVVWSAVATMKEVLAWHNHPEDPDLFITEADFGLAPGELEAFPDPGIRVDAGWSLWVDWCEHQGDRWAMNANYN